MGFRKRWYINSFTYPHPFCSLPFSPVLLWCNGTNALGVELNNLRKQKKRKVEESKGYREHNRLKLFLGYNWGIDDNARILVFVFLLLIHGPTRVIKKLMKILFYLRTLVPSPSIQAVISVFLFFVSLFNCWEETSSYPCIMYHIYAIPSSFLLLTHNQPMTWRRMHVRLCPNYGKQES